MKGETMNSAGKLLGTLVVAVGLLAATLPDEAWGRAGRGGSFGSRGSRSFSSPSRSYSAPSRPTSPSTQPGPTPAPVPQSSPMGGFWRSMAGGVVGGILGGMLFRSLGFAGGYGGGFGGGFGLFELVLLAGIGYMIYRMVRRSRGEEATAGSYYGRMSADSYGSTGAAMATADAPPSAAEDLEPGLAHIRQMDPRFDEVRFKEWSNDTFFRVQAAWMHRDLEKMRSLLTEEMQEEFRKQIDELRANRQFNKLENIAVRSVELTEAWQEQGRDYITVRFLASLLDYNVDEASGKVLSGTDSEPVKFEEYWTWVRPVGPNPWKLSAINQAE
ncbi:MAG: Tim44 domain-containing protein [candidate division NC10 bacterium]|nr:Tim44 domain-containing protein [candidate division NC10 bacterium]